MVRSPLRGPRVGGSNDGLHSVFEASRSLNTDPPESPNADLGSDGPLRPVRRERRESPTTSGISGVEAFDRITRFRVFLWSLVGAFVGFFFGVLLDVPGGVGVVVILATTVMGSMAPPLFMKGVGRAAGGLYAPSGRSTPPKPEYSLAESYAARGHYDEAIAAFEQALAEDSADPTPYLRIARIKRDRLGDDAGAAAWFKRALSESDMSAGVTSLTLKEVVELYEVRMGQPARATPLLARVAEESAGTPDGKWARETLERIKSQMAKESDEA